jgi:hypothetical protein
MKPLICILLLFFWLSKITYPEKKRLDFVECNRSNQLPDSVIYKRILAFQFRKYINKKSIADILHDLKLKHTQVLPMQEPPGIVSSISYKFGNKIYLNFKVQHYRYFTPVMDSVRNNKEYLSLYLKEIPFQVKIKYRGVITIK